MSELTEATIAPREDITIGAKRQGKVLSTLDPLDLRKRLDYRRSTFDIRRAIAKLSIIIPSPRIDSSFIIQCKTEIIPAFDVYNFIFFKGGNWSRGNDILSTTS